MKLHINIFRDFWKLIFKIKNSGEQEKESIIHVRSVPPGHHLSSLVKPRDAKPRSSGRIFLSYPHTHDRFLFSHMGKNSGNHYLTHLNHSIILTMHKTFKKESPVLSFRRIIVSKASILSGKQKTIMLIRLCR